MTDPQGSAVPRKLSATAATALVVANMIGTGVFTTTGFMAKSLESPLWVVALWLLGGVFALSGATVYAELGSMMPRVGGEYVYLRRALHPIFAFLSGWVSLIVGFSAPIAASAYAVGAYLNAAFPQLGVIATGSASILVLSSLHLFDVLWGSRVQTVLTAYKVLLVTLFIVGAFTLGHGNFSHFDVESNVHSADLGVALIFVSFSYSGWNAAAYLGGEIKEPGRSLPRALLGGTAIVTGLYVGLNIAFFYAAPIQQLADGAERVAQVAASALFGSVSGSALSVLISLALVSSVSAMIMAGPRVYEAMARDRAFFSVLSRRNKRGSPAAAILLQAGIALLLLLTTTFESLLLYIGFTLSLFAGLTIVAAMVLRRNQPHADRPYRAWAWPLSPLLFLGLSLWMILHSIASRPVVALYGFGTLAVGTVFHRLWQRRVAATPL